MSMLVDFSIFPIGAGVSLAEPVAAVIRLLDAAGLDHRLGPMGTLIEGDWNRIAPVIGECFALLHRDHPRVAATVKIDSRLGRSGLMDGKVASVRAKLADKP